MMRMRRGLSGDGDEKRVHYLIMELRKKDHLRTQGCLVTGAGGGQDYLTKGEWERHTCQSSEKDEKGHDYLMDKITR